jgi:outer membrane protein assembly factor BamA
MYLGGSNSIRGWPLNSRRGNNSVIGTIEYRLDLMEKRSIKKGFDLGISGILFYDIGYSYNNLNKFSDTKPISSAGVGIRFYVPMVDEVRLSYGFRTDGSGGGIAFNVGTRF